MSRVEVARAILRPIWRVVGPIVRGPSRIRAKVRRQILGLRVDLQPGVVLFPAARLGNNRPREAIRIGSRTRVFGRLETMGHGGEISIGCDCFIGENSYIWSASCITIGDRVLISHGVNIHDNISHSLSAAERHSHFHAIFNGGHPKELDNVPTKPIVIEDDAWIGFGATVLKGVTVGRGSIVGAQSVVTKDVPPFTIVVGNPAREIGKARP